MALKDAGQLLDTLEQTVLDAEELDYAAFVSVLIKEMGSQQLNVLHMAVGVSGEAGELLDAVKKYWAYNKDLDVDNVVEELGDLEFYMAGMRLLLGITRDYVLSANRVKLNTRYQGAYSDAAAQARADKEPAPQLQIIDMSNEDTQSLGALRDAVKAELANQDQTASEVPSSELPDTPQ